MNRRDTGNVRRRRGLGWAVVLTGLVCATAAVGQDSDAADVGTDAARVAAYEGELMSIQERVLSEQGLPRLMNDVERIDAGTLAIHVTQAWGSLPRAEQKRIMGWALELWAQQQDAVRPVGVAMVAPDGREFGKVTMDPSDGASAR